MSSKPCARKLVADTGPLIALARLELLEILPLLFSQTIISRQVFEESQFYPHRMDAQRIAAAVENGALACYSVETDNTLARTSHLGAGETSSITLALQHQCPVLLDDKAARTIAKQAGVKILGIAGLLVYAKEQQVLPSVSQHLDKLEQHQYYLSREIIRRIKQLAGE